MRSCIGALQFSAAKTHSFTSADVDSAAVSKKDKVPIHYRRVTELRTLSNAMRNILLA
jgi:hypothetical protein